MDYKNTLNLPQTAFPMKADLITREPARLKKWETAGLYASIQADRVGAEKFVLHDGPPFANGEVHIGTALNKILKDIIIKYKTLHGFSAPYVPGWDCHGLPIEFKVTQDMRKAGDTASDASTIRKACDAYAHKYIGIQRAQFKRLGVFGDWDNPYLTLAKEYEADELRLFADIVEQGFVYRGKKPVYWSIPCRTALAEAEVEYKDHVSQSVYVKFPLVGHPATAVVIWTTTPWTLPANLAVAYNSTLSYSLVHVGGEEFIVSALLLPALAEKCGWQNYQIVRSLDGGHLSQVEYQHPFCNRNGKFFAGDSFVDNVTGTGFVHIAPGHGLDDYNLGRQNNLPIYSPVDDDGKLALTSDLPKEQQMPAEDVGQSILEKHGKSEANEAVLHELRARKALLHQENYHHSYPHCWRSKTPIIFRAMDQWFIEIDHRVGQASRLSQTEESGTGETPVLRSFRERAHGEINRVNWVPDWGKSRIEAAVKGRPDWCISRQRTWGVPIPAFYDAQGNPILDAQIVRNAAALVEKHGSNVWFERSSAELWTALKPADWKGPEPATKSNDTLDVWFDSGTSSRSVLMRRPELHHAPRTTQHAVSQWQADMYLEGSDQHRGWFQSSLLLSLAGNGAAPFKTVLTHGFMVDADREKISKSKQGQGGYEKPQTSDTYVKKYGADIVRLWVSSQDFRADIIVSEERISKVAETYRVHLNALRYQLSNHNDFDPAKHAVPEEGMTVLDRWMPTQFNQLESRVLASYEAYEFHVVYQKVSQFIAVELSSIYHDVIKDRLYTDPANSHRRRSTQTTLHRLVTSLCQMLAPILAFTADEAWEFVPGKPTGSVHEANWQPIKFSVLQGNDVHERWQPVFRWHFLFEKRAILLTHLETERKAKVIGKSLDAKIQLHESDPLLKDGVINEFRELVNVSQIEITKDSNAKLVVHADGQKCERCWHWETDIGQNPEHPT